MEVDEEEEEEAEEEEEEGWVRMNLVEDGREQRLGKGTQTPVKRSRKARMKRTRQEAWGRSRTLAHGTVSSPRGQPFPLNFVMLHDQHFKTA